MTRVMQSLCCAPRSPVAAPPAPFPFDCRRRECLYCDRDQSQSALSGSPTSSVHSISCSSPASNQKGLSALGSLSLSRPCSSFAPLKTAPFSRTAMIKRGIAPAVALSV